MARRMAGNAFPTIRRDVTERFTLKGGIGRPLSESRPTGLHSARVDPERVPLGSEAEADRSGHGRPPWVGGMGPPKG